MDNYYNQHNIDFSLDNPPKARTSFDKKESNYRSNITNDISESEYNQHPNKTKIYQDLGLNSTNRNSHKLNFAKQDFYTRNDYDKNTFSQKYLLHKPKLTPYSSKEDLEFMSSYKLPAIKNSIPNPSHETTGYNPSFGKKNITGFNQRSSADYNYDEEPCIIQKSDYDMSSTQKTKNTSFQTILNQYSHQNHETNIPNYSFNKKYDRNETDPTYYVHKNLTPVKQLSSKTICNEINDSYAPGILSIISAANHLEENHPKASKTRNSDANYFPKFSPDNRSGFKPLISSHPIDSRILSPENTKTPKKKLFFNNSQNEFLKPDASNLSLHSKNFGSTFSNYKYQNHYQAQQSSSSDANSAFLPTFQPYFHNKKPESISSNYKDRQKYHDLDENQFIKKQDCGNALHQPTESNHRFKPFDQKYKPVNKNFNHEISIKSQNNREYNNNAYKFNADCETVNSNNSDRISVDDILESDYYYLKSPKHFSINNNFNVNSSNQENTFQQYKQKISNNNNFSHNYKNNNSSREYHPLDLNSSKSSHSNEFTHHFNHTQSSEAFNSNKFAPFTETKLSINENIVQSPPKYKRLKFSQKNISHIPNNDCNLPSFENLDSFVKKSNATNTIKHYESSVDKYYSLPYNKNGNVFLSNSNETPFYSEKRISLQQKTYNTDRIPRFKNNLPYNRNEKILKYNNNLHENDLVYDDLNNTNPNCNNNFYTNYNTNLPSLNFREPISKSFGHISSQNTFMNKRSPYIEKYKFGNFDEYSENRKNSNSNYLLPKIANSSPIIDNFDTWKITMKKICVNEIKHAYEKVLQSLLLKTYCSKQISSLCQKVVLKNDGILSFKNSKNELKSDKFIKEIRQKSKASMRESLIFWKRYEKEERIALKIAEKELLEKQKLEEEAREITRQKRKLDFMISQTELYSYFAGANIDINAKKDLSPVCTRSAKFDKTKKETPDLDFDKVTDEALISHAKNKAQQAFTKQKENVKNFDKEISSIIISDSVSSLNLESPLILKESDDIEQPKMIVYKLKEYQLNGLKWLVSLYEQGINGILADEMGLGKTVQSISLIAYLAEKYNIWGPILVVTPASTLHNWQQEIFKFAPQLKVLPYWGTLKDRKVLRKSFWNLKNLGRENSPFHILVTSYNLAVTDEFYLNRVKWRYMILDEAQAIKSSKSYRWTALLSFHCRNRLLLTGTPVQNNLQELWSLLHFIMPTLFDSNEEFSKWFSRDIEAHAENNVLLNNTQLLRLHAILKPFMLRRLKAHVQLELGEKNEHLVYCNLTYKQITMYSGLLQNISVSDLLARLQNSSTASKLSQGNGNSEDNLMNLVMQLRKVCNHPDLFSRAEVESPLVLNGSSKISARRNLVMDWQTKPEIFVFLLSTRAGGLGINLTAADTVIFYDSDWNPTVDLQAMDRAHRLGQTKQVNVYRLVTKNTIEEKILARAQKKNHIRKMVISGGTAHHNDTNAESEVESVFSEESTIETGGSNVAFSNTSKTSLAKSSTDSSFLEIGLDNVVKITDNSKKKSDPRSQNGIDYNGPGNLYDSEFKEITPNEIASLLLDKTCENTFKEWSNQLVESRKNIMRKI
ncbi:hypothetical protein BB561_002065 [Smittium simulii]|uniref:Chromatin-remodeling ATPase INO80 n=1 Tax=Smittium simulii TaxID=133385 RepID=A0A2T9YRU7_9FUNG|nr:hypothetical protein BB561_002065 [Smittium simulii]